MKIQFLGIFVIIGVGVILGEVRRIAPGFDVSGNDHYIVFAGDSVSEILVYDIFGDSVFCPIPHLGIEEKPDIFGEEIVCHCDNNVLYGTMSSGFFSSLTFSTHFQGDARITDHNIGWIDTRWGSAWGSHPCLYDFPTTVNTLV